MSDELEKVDEIKRKINGCDSLNELKQVIDELAREHLGLISRDEAFEYAIVDKRPQVNEGYI